MVGELAWGGRRHAGSPSERSGQGCTTLCYAMKCSSGKLWQPAVPSPALLRNLVFGGMPPKIEAVQSVFEGADFQPISIFEATTTVTARCLEFGPSQSSESWSHSPLQCQPPCLIQFTDVTVMASCRAQFLAPRAVLPAHTQAAACFLSEHLFTSEQEMLQGLLQYLKGVRMVWMAGATLTRLGLSAGSCDSASKVGKVFFRGLPCT